MPCKPWVLLYRQIVRVSFGKHRYLLTCVPSAGTPAWLMQAVNASPRSSLAKSASLVQSLDRCIIRESSRMVENMQAVDASPRSSLRRSCERSPDAVYACYSPQSSLARPASLVQSLDWCIIRESSRMVAKMQAVHTSP